MGKQQNKHQAIKRQVKEQAKQVKRQRAAQARDNRRNHK